MSADAHGVARDQLRAFIERVERLSEEKKTIEDDIKDVYGEAKAMGYCVKTMKKIVALRKIDEHKRTEEELILDTYKAALGMIPQIEMFDEEDAPKQTKQPPMAKSSPRGDMVSEVNPRLIQQVVTGMQTETGRAALIAAVDIMIEREEAEEFQAKASGDNGATGQADEEAADSMTGDASRTSRGVDTPATNSPSDDDAIAAVKGKARLANVADVDPSSSAPIAPASQGEAEAPSVESVSPETHGSSDANTGGEDVTLEQNAAPRQAEALVSKTASAAHPILAIRPHCQHPGEEVCGGSGRNHCRACTAAMREEEVA